MLERTEIQFDKLSKDYWISKVKSFQPEDARVSLNDNTISDIQRISFDDAKNFVNLANNNAISEWVLFLSIYTVLINKYFNCTESLIASIPLQAHDAIKDEKQLAIYNLKYDPILSFKQLLNNTKQEVLESSKYRAFFKEELLTSCQALEISTDSIFQFGLSYEALRTAPLPLNTVTFEVSISKGLDKGFELEVLYDPQLYSKDLIRSFLIHFKSLVKAVKNVLNNSLLEISIISEEEKNEIVYTFNATETFYSKEKTVIDLFEEQVLKTPESVAVSCDESVLTYNELSNKINKLANYLKNRIGIVPNDLVGVMLDRSEEFVVAVMAILKVGATYVPIDVNYPTDRIQFMLDDSGVKLLITEECQCTHFASFDKNILILEKEMSAINEESFDFHQRLATSESLVYVIYTSGSTGKPKGVMVKHSGFANLINWYSDLLNLSEGLCVLLIAPISFDLAQKNIFAPLVSGAKLYLSEKIHGDYEAIASIIEKEQVNIVNSAPSAFYPLLHVAKDNGYKKLDSLRHVVLGGEPIHLREFLPWADSAYCNTELVNSYGPTECTDVVSFYRLSKDKWMDATSIPIGFPIYNTQLYVLDQFLQITPIGVQGEIYIGGVGVSAGYLGSRALTDSKFVASPFNVETKIYKTGDLGYWLSDGAIEYVGRSDDQVKIRGFRIELGEIETWLKRYDKIREAAVVAISNDSGEKYLVGHLVSDELVSVAEIRAYLGSVLPDHMIPGYFVQVDVLPLTPSGKLDRKSLAAREHESLNQSPYIAPRNSTEQKLVEIWEEVLGAKQVGTSDDFFEKGGHSLKIIQLVSRIRKEFRVDIDVKDIFNTPTLERQAEIISTSNRLEENSISAIPENSSYELSHAQKRMWILSQFSQSSLAYNISTALWFEGMLDQSILEQAFKHVIFKHESLRTVFRTNDEGEIRQFVLPETDCSIQLHKEDIKDFPNQENYIRSSYEREQQEAFNLAEGPLLRFHLMTVSDDKHVLFFTMHHIISDGWSMQVLSNEIVRIYNALLKGVVLPSRPLRIQYKDYAFWQNQWLVSEKVKLQETYWLEQLAGELPVLNLPSEKKRPLIKTHAGRSIQKELDKSLTARLKNICSEQGCTLFMGLLASLNGIFYRYTTQEDIIIGTPVAGREIHELEEQIGLYLNTLALRTKFDGNDSFLELLTKTKDVLLGAYSNRSYPFDRLVDKLQLQRDISRSPLFDILIVLHNQSDIAIDKGVLLDIKTSAWNGLNKTTSQFDLTFEFKEVQDVLSLQLIYNSDIYSKEDIEDLYLHYVEFLSSVLLTPLAHISSIEFLNKDVKKQLLYSFNNTTQSYSRTQTLIDLFEEQVAETPDSIALVYQEKQLTYKKLNDYADCVCNYLKTVHRIQAGDLVGVMMGRSELMIAGLLGILKAGAAYVPIDVNYPKDRIHYIINDSHPVVLLTEISSLQIEGVPSINIEECFTHKEIVHFEQRAKATDIAYVIYTSGSTGNPKGVMITHENAVNLVRWASNTYSIEELSGVLASTSICFDLSVFEIFAPLSIGGRIVVVNTALDLIRNAPEYISLVNTVPSVITELLDADAIPLSVKTINLAGEPLRKHIVDRLYGHKQIEKVYNLYGPSETTTYSTGTLVDKDKDGEPTIGKPLLNTNVYILDPNAKLLPLGMSGELYIGGSGISKGYLNKEELTSDRFIDHPFIPDQKIYRTGDICRWLRDGNLEYLGRTDHQVKIRGFRIELGEIESQLLNYESITQTVVTVNKDKDENQYLVAYVVSLKSLQPTEVLNYLNERLPAYMLPSNLIQLERLPLTSNGKIDRKALPDPSEVVRAIEFEEAKTEVEIQLVSIWKEVLGREQIGVTDNFFSIGGHSLKAVKILSRIEKQFDIRIDITTLFSNPTVRGISNELEKISWVNTRSNESNPDNEKISI